MRWHAPLLFAPLAGLALVLSPAAQARPTGAPGTAAVVAAAALAPNRYVWAEDAVTDAVADVVAQPVSVVVSIADQRAYVYRGETLIAMSTVSTGRDGKETPVGVYPVLQKKAMHKSNLYDAAPMPFMQRLTWDGIALHAGRNPGFPDSHGCIRLPAAFAKRLFATTTVGTTVTVIDATLPAIESGDANLAPYETARAAQAEAARKAMEVQHANAAELASYRP